MVLWISREVWVANEPFRGQYGSKTRPVRPYFAVDFRSLTISESIEAVTVEKFATAHDLRRSFGTQWAKRVMPAVLKRLMRHAEIGTTMKYYVTIDADDVADEFWGQNWASGNNRPTKQKRPPPKNVKLRLTRLWGWIGEDIDLV